MVILTTGKYAGKKAVVLRVFDEGTATRQFAHCLVVGLRTEPGRVRPPCSERRTELTVMLSDQKEGF